MGMTNPSTLPGQTAPTFLAVEDAYGGFICIEQGTIDGAPYTIRVSMLYGTLAEAQAEANRRALEAQA